MDCRKCGAHLTTDEKAIYMKLVSRNASSFLCMDCLAEALQRAHPILSGIWQLCAVSINKAPLYREKYNSGEEGFCVFASNEPKFMLA